MNLIFVAVQQLFHGLMEREYEIFVKHDIFDGAKGNQFDIFITHQKKRYYFFI